MLFLFCVSTIVEAQICGTTAAWSRVITYNGGEEVQYNGVKYQAKWWTRDQAPDVNSATASDPWIEIGNCDGSVDTLSCAGISVWVVTTAYNFGERVIYNNNIYIANYYSLNRNPETNNGQTGSGSPWTFVGACESTTESTCDLSTPSFEFDLTGAPDSLWLSPQVRRDGLCCSIDPTERPPARCVEFFFTLDPSAIGIIFDIQSGAVPPGALFFQINCQGRYQFGELLCLSGSGPYRLTFCKPGNNPNVYAIQSVAGPKVSPPVTVSDGCSADIYAEGYDLSTVQWTSVPSNPVWESYMSCTSQCDSVHVQYQPGAPDSVIYQVSGYPPGGCLPDPVVKQTVVYFVNDKTADIQPKDAMVCFGSNTAELTVYPSGGRPPHRYLWSTGETTQSIFVAQGSYSVQVFDNTTCPSAFDSVDVGAFLFPIEALAGPDQRLCSSTNQVQLAGQVIEALGGRWSGGLGSFSPNDSTLNAVYTPTATEKTTGVTLTLTTTGNRGCPGDDDQVTITFDANPVIVAPDTAYACVNNPIAQIAASFSDASFLKWETINGGTFQPNDSALTVFYTPTAAEIAANSTMVLVTADGNPSCPAVSDTVVVSFTSPPTVNVGPAQTTCSNNPSSVSLTASPTIATGVVWRGGNGVYSPSNAGLSVSYQPTLIEASSAFITLTATTTDNKGCLPVSETVRVNFSPPPRVVAMPDLAVCANAVNIPVTSTITNATGVVWSRKTATGTLSATSGLNTTFTPSAADVTRGFVVLTATTTNNRGCLNHADDVRITFDTPPSVALPTPIFVCSNNSITQIDAALTNADSVSWSFGGTGSTRIIDFNTVEYSPSIADTVAGSVTVSATTISTSICPETTFNSTIQFTGSPSVVVSSGGNSCANNPQVQLNAVTNGASFGVLWIGGNGVFAPDRITKNARYLPSASEIAAGTVNLTVQTTNVGDCLPTTDDISISIKPAPVVNAGPDQLLCLDNNGTTLAGTSTNSVGVVWQSNSGGSFSASTAINSNYTFSPSDKADSSVTLVLSSTGNAPCLEVFDFVTIQLHNVPRVDAGSDITLCTAQDSTNLNGVVTLANTGTWTTNGTGAFSPSNTQLKTGYIPSAADRSAGNVVLTLTSGAYSTCNTYSDQMIISFANGPVLNMMGDSTVCRNVSEFPVSASGSLGEWSGSGAFLSGVSAHNNVYQPTTAELASPSTKLKFTTFATTFCPSIEDSVTITFVDGPLLDPLIADTICSNEGVFNLSSNQTNATGVSWSSNGFGNIVNPLLNTIQYDLSANEINTVDTLQVQFTVRTTGNGICTETAQRVINTIVPQNNVVIQSAGVVCLSQGVIQLSAVGNSNETYAWSTNGGGSFSAGNVGLNVQYQMVSSDTLLDSLRFIVLSENNPYCNDFSDTTYFTIVTGPSVDAGPPIAVCKDVQEIEITGSAIKNTSQRWTTNGTGVFINADSLVTRYVRSDSDTAMGAVKAYLNVVGEGGCDVLIDSMTITFEEGINVAISAANQICKDSAFVQLSVNFTKATGVSWEVVNGIGVLDDSTLTTPVYTLNDQDKNLDSLIFRVTTTGNDDCFAQTDEVIVDLLPEPTVFGPDVIICQDALSVALEGQVLNAGGIDFDVLGAGTVSKISAAQSSYSIMPTDTVQDSLIVVYTSTNNGICKPVSDSLSIFFTPKPTVDVGNDTVVCISSSYIDLGGQITVSTGWIWASDGTGNFVPDAMTLNARYVFSAADKQKGSVSFTLITLVNGTCQAYLDSKTVSFSEPVTIVPTTASACQSGVGAIPIVPVVQNALSYEWKTLGTGSFSPTAAVKDVLYQPSATDRLIDSVVVRLIARSCTVDSLDFTLYFEPGPQIVASADDEICVGETSSFNFSTQFAETKSWINLASGQVLPSVADSIIQYIPSAADIALGGAKLVAQASKTGCPTVYDTVNLQILKRPIANAGNDRNLCREQKNITVAGVSQFGSSVHWETLGSGTFSNPASKTTVYTFSTSDTQLDSLYLYFVIDAFECFPSIRDSILINFSNAPIVDAGPDQVVCTEDLAVVFDGVYNNASGIRWTTLGSGTFDDNNATNPYYFFSTADANAKGVQVVVETIGASACNHDKDTVKVTFVSSPQVEIGSDKVYCGVLPDIPLNATVKDATSWEWYSNGVGSFLGSINDLNTTYRAAEIDTIVKQITLSLFAAVNGGCFVYDTLDVIFEAPPRILIENTKACVGDVIQLLGKPDGFISQGADYSWFLNNAALPGVKDSTISVTQTGRYKVVMKIDECNANKEADIIFDPVPEKYPNRQIYICEEQGESVVVKGEGINPAYKYYWPHVNDSVRAVVINDDGLYSYTIINEFGCTSINSIILEDICPPRLFPPTIFTPNGDGKNDWMTIKGKFVEKYNLTIFNRWGEIIFYTENMDDYWDGNFRGQPMPEGVYNWIIEYQGDDRISEPVVLKGIITVVR